MLMRKKEIFSRKIETIAVRSLLYEVSATPKPGLVDRKNSGAHNDMDFFTFIDSSTVLGEIFYHCVLTGIEHKEGIETLLEAIRPIGVIGENKMFSATKGINTHKGLIFSLGIISAVVGYLYGQKEKTTYAADEICNHVQLMTKGLIDKELKKNLNKPLTYGERLYKKYGITGIRGEVTSGFLTVRKYGLPILKKLMKSQKGSLNDRFIEVLLYLIANTKDSNILGRHDLHMLEKVQLKASCIINQGGVFSENGITLIKEFDKWCIKHWVSPGGAADLLAVTIMLYFLENLRSI